MKPAFDHPWNQKGNGVYLDYTEETAKLPLWWRFLDNAIDGGPPDPLLLRHAKQGLLYAHRLPPNTREYAPEDLVSGIRLELPSTCRKCEQTFSAVYVYTGRSPTLRRLCSVCKKESREKQKEKFRAYQRLRYARKRLELAPYTSGSE
ncbi:MAG: hypothetical protein H0U59_00955, partial [Gemmatimonadaceae bacterium]|nr:hypothetical protein [Gemmatimonadaceae bacterium]